MIDIETLDAKFKTVSSEYKLVKTNDLVSSLESQGFIAEKFIANKTRKVEKRGYQKHRVILSHPTLLQSTNDGRPQLLLTNSHDGSSCVVLQLGFFRMVCSNGLVVGKTIGLPIKLRHDAPNLYYDLERGVEKIVAQCEALNNAINKMKAHVMTENEVKAFQARALGLRLANTENVQSFHYSINRSEDTSLDLFTVMNVIQENLIRGGARVIVNQNDKTRNKTLRPINSIQAQTDINATLWDYASELMAA